MKTRSLLGIVKLCAPPSFSGGDEDRGGCVVHPYELRCGWRWTRGLGTRIIIIPQAKNIKTRLHNIYSSSVQPLLLLVNGIILFQKRDYTGDITFYGIIICNKKHYFITIISSHGFEWPPATRYYCTAISNAIES